MLDVRSTFKDHGLRCTRQRELVYQALASSNAHPTADELFQALTPDPEAQHDTQPESALSLATVYNTLEAFSCAGLIRKIPAPDGKGPCRYDADLSDHAHAALPDGRLVDVPPDLSHKLVPRLSGDLARELAARLGIEPGRLSVQVIVHPRDERDCRCLDAGPDCCKG